MPYTDYVNYPNLAAPSNWVGGDVPGGDSWISYQKDVAGFWANPQYGTVGDPANAADEPNYFQFPTGAGITSAADPSTVVPRGLGGTSYGLIGGSVEPAYRGSMLGLTLPEPVLLRRLFLRARPALGNFFVNYAPIYDEIRVFGYDDSRDATLPPTGIVITPGNQALLTLLSGDLGQPGTPFTLPGGITSARTDFVSERIYMLELPSPFPVRHLRIASVWAFMDLRIMGIHLDTEPIGAAAPTLFWTGFNRTRERSL